MANNGLLKLYQYPLRPDYVPLDNSDLIEKYIYFEQKMGLTGSIESLLNVYPEFEKQVHENVKLTMHKN